MGTCPKPPGIYPVLPGTCPKFPGIYPKLPGTYPKPPGIYPKPPGICPKLPGNYPKPPGIYPKSSVIPVMARGGMTGDDFVRANGIISRSTRLALPDGTSWRGEALFCLAQMITMPSRPYFICQTSHVTRHSQTCILAYLHTRHLHTRHSQTRKLALSML